MKLIKRISQQLVKHRYGAMLWTFLAAAALTGAVCVLFMWAFEFVLDHRLDAHRIGAWCWVTTPLLFLAAVELIRRMAPYADGAGIPQTIFAASHFSESLEKRLRPLVSARTMAVKMAALLVGVWAGASTGREGPTVHVAACVSFSVILIVRRFTRLNLDLRSNGYAKLLDVTPTIFDFFGVPVDDFDPPLEGRSLLLPLGTSSSTTTSLATVSTTTVTTTSLP